MGNGIVLGSKHLEQIQSRTHRRMAANRDKSHRQVHAQTCCCKSAHHEKTPDMKPGVFVAANAVDQ